MPRHVVSIVAALLLMAGLAGCLAEPETPAAIDDAGHVVSVAPPPLAFSEEGSLALQALACPPVGCIGPGVGGQERLWETDVAGDLAAVELTMTWEASSPLMEELALGIFTCGEVCESDADIIASEYAFGTSPLVLSLAGFPVGPGETLYVFASPPGRTPLVYSAVTTPQAFLIEGAFTLAEPGAAGSGTLDVSA